MAPRRLRAPAEDGGLLAEPPLAEAPAILAANRASLGAWDHDFQGRRAGRLRAMARAQAFARAREYAERSGLDAPDHPDPNGPLVVTGHQPELFHPGVWVKNFAVAAIGREVGGAALNLIVDNDTPKSTAVRVPTRAGGRLRTLPVEFDEWSGEIPYEDLPVRDEARFAAFADRVNEVLDGDICDPMIDEFWPLARRAAERTDRLGLRFAIARRALEASWGVRNAEVPLGAVCETEGFLWFAAHLLAHLPRFQEVHNAALLHYRAAHGLRSRHHPVPELGREGDWLEAPFWAWRAESPRRRPLMARQLARTMELRIAGEDAPLIEIPLSPDRDACCAVEALQGLPGRGVRLRSRALTTTMFARTLLADLFVHGIGGAKYDELGDEVARDFFGVEPPPFLTLSMTLRLGLPEEPAGPDALRAVARDLRDLTFNPDRHLGAVVDPAIQRLVDAKRHAIAGAQDTHAERVARLRAIRRCNEALQVTTEAARVRLIAARARLAAGLAHNALARSREYPVVLHSRRRFRAAIARAVPGVLA